MKPPLLGALIQSFFVEHLVQVKGLRPSSIRSYRDAMRLFLLFVARDAKKKITRLFVDDLTFERVLNFLRHLEEERRNHVRTRNQRLALLHTFFEYVATRRPELLNVAERVAAIPVKRTSPSATRFLERDEIRQLFASMPTQGAAALRDRALLLFLYNTGARVQEVADLCVEDLDLADSPRARLHGKGDKWRVCPLWDETARVLRTLIAARSSQVVAVFSSRSGRPLTRFGIHKIVRRHTLTLKTPRGQPRVSPHIFRHTTAVHLLESGVEVNVIRGWLGHVSLETTNRYAEINIRAKENALRLCEPPANSAEFPRKAVWRSDETLLDWLNSL